MAQKAHPCGPVGQGRRAAGCGDFPGIAGVGLRQRPDAVCRWRGPRRPMSKTSPDAGIAILQMNPLSPLLEQELASRFAVHRLPDVADRERFLGEYAGSIQAVVTGGHIGLPNDLLERLPALKIVAING